MKIYTRTGDSGETGLFGGQRVPKTHPRVVAYGTVDELNAVLGQAVAGCEGQASIDRGTPGPSDGSTYPWLNSANPVTATNDADSGATSVANNRDGCQDLAERLRAIQSRLFDVGADLASPPDTKAGAWLPTRVQSAWARGLEAEIDRFESDLPPLVTFILPGGTPLAAALHLARTVCRRAEREVIAALDAGEVVGDDVVIYLNRLSDWLFVAARWVNWRAGVAEAPWHGGDTSS